MIEAPKVDAGGAGKVPIDAGLIIGNDNGGGDGAGIGRGGAGEVGLQG